MRAAALRQVNAVLTESAWRGRLFPNLGPFAAYVAN